MRNEDKMKKQEELINTLSFFYFGYTEADGEDAFIRSLVKRAYRDATMRAAFDKKSLGDEADTKEGAVINAVCERIKKIKGLNSEKDFDDWHRSLCETLCKEYEMIKDKSGKNPFSYGNAQKVVNMSLKYIYLFSDLYNGGIFKEIKKYASYLHMPIDSYIIDALFENKILTYEYCNKSDESCLHNFLGSWKGGTREGKNRFSDRVGISWSNWDEKLYTTIMQKIRKEKPPEYDNMLDWENVLWMKQAKIIRDENSK